MLGLTLTPPLTAVESDPAVADAKARLDEAIGNRLILEAEEKRLRQIMVRNYVGGHGSPPTDEELEDAFAKLAPPDPTVTVPSFFILPAAHAARKAEPKLRREYLATCVSVRHRLHQAGLAQLRPLFHKLNHAIKAAETPRKECDALRTALVEFGAEERALPELPPSLGPHGALAWEWRLVQEQLIQREADLLVVSD